MSVVLSVSSLFPPTYRNQEEKEDSRAASHTQAAHDTNKEGDFPVGRTFGTPFAHFVVSVFLCLGRVGPGSTAAGISSRFPASV